MKKVLFFLFIFLNPLISVIYANEWRNWPLEKKIGQLMVVPVCPTHGEDHFNKVSKLLKEREIGGIIFMQGTSDQQLELIKRFNEAVSDPLMTYQDAEWGVAMRLTDIPPLPKNLTLGAIQDLGLLRAFGRGVARQCRLVGIACDFAPVADVNSNSLNPVIGIRSFGDDPEEVAKRANAVMKGMKEGGIYTCAKHFPGHGDTIVDSHKDLPCIHKTLSEIEVVELIPFQELINEGVDLVMIGHLLFPELSPLPSSLAPEVVTELLRGKMGFDGVIITDSLTMSALSSRYTIEEIAEMALFAGNDILLTASSKPEVVDYLITEAIPKAIDHIAAAVPEELIDERLGRVMALKEKTHGPLPLADPNLCQTLFQHAITLVGNPVKVKGPIALVQSTFDPDFYEALQQDGEVVLFAYDQIEEMAGFETIIVQVGPKDHLTKIPERAIIALFDTPYRLKEWDHPSVLIGYENVLPAKKALANVLFGKIPALGKLPVRVYTK